MVESRTGTDDTNHLADVGLMSNFGGTFEYRT